MISCDEFEALLWMPQDMDDDESSMFLNHLITCPLHKTELEESERAVVSWLRLKLDGDAED